MSYDLIDAAGKFLKTAFANEDRLSGPMMRSLKSSNGPWVHSDIIVTTNFADLYGENDEFHPAPSFKRSAYNHILKRDTKAKSITSTDKMVVSFIEINHRYRLDVEFHCVVHDDGDDIHTIDVLDVDLHSGVMDEDAETDLMDWFLTRIFEIEGPVQKGKGKRSAGHLTVVVDNTALERLAS